MADDPLTPLAATILETVPSAHDSNYSDALAGVAKPCPLEARSTGCRPPGESEKHFDVATANTESHATRAQFRSGFVSLGQTLMEQHDYAAGSCSLKQR